MFSWFDRKTAFPSRTDPADLPDLTKPASLTEDTLPQLPRLYPIFPERGLKEDTSVDIIAVHGIETSSPKTWIAFQSDVEPKGRSFHWLKDSDMLPSKVRNARIWLFDYNSNYSHDAQNVRFPGLATALLYCMQDRFEDFHSRPILFIGSCFGGIVIAEALAKAAQEQDNSDRNRIFHQTIGVVFLGSPLRGTKVAKFAEWRAFLSGTLLQMSEPSTALICDIEENASSLEKSIEVFAKLTRARPDFEIRCFYETRKTQILNAITRKFPFKPEEVLVSLYLCDDEPLVISLKLVERASACLDGHEAIPLEVRHAMMNKYRGPDDPNFNLVAGRIKEIVDKSERKPSMTEEEQRAMRTFSSDYRAQKDFNPRRVPGTCEWFLRHKVFLKWKRSTEANLLWVTADPGCGKSVLARTLIDEGLLHPDEPDIITTSVCYFFFKDDLERGSGTNALRSVLHQLFEQKPRLLRHALKTLRKNEVLDLGNLWDIFNQAVADKEAGPVVCIFDGLDECESEACRRLISKLSVFYSMRKLSTSKLKFLVLSRPYSRLEVEFGSNIEDLPSIQLRGEEKSTEICKEINLFIEYRITKICNVRKLDRVIQNHLVEHIRSLENRTYLWVYLMLEEIQYSLESSKSSLQKLLKSIPNSIEDAYSKILQRAVDPAQARMILNLILAARRPLTLPEMNMALELQLNDGVKSLKEIELDKKDHFRIKVRNLCGLFVTVIKEKVYLIHQTAKEFLTAGNDVRQWSSTCWMHCFSMPELYFGILRTCIDYLLLLDADEDDNDDDDDANSFYSTSTIQDVNWQLKDRHILLEYSSKSWPLHFQEAWTLIDEKTTRDALQLCNMSSKPFSLWSQGSRHVMAIREIPPNAPILLVSCLGLTQPLLLLLQADDTDVNVKDKQGRCALKIAVSEGQPGPLRLLLERADVIIPEDLLYIAVESRYPGIVKLLLEVKQCDVNWTNGLGGRTPLCIAASVGDMEIVKLLLGHPEVKVDLGDYENSTPLHYAASQGHPAIVRLLINRTDVDANARNIFGQTPLHDAAKFSKDQTIRLLAKRPDVDTEVRDNDGLTPLAAAARAGASTAIAILLEFDNVDPNSIDDYGRTPLALAVKEGKRSTVELLLAQPNVDVNTIDYDGMTPLALAKMERDKDSYIIDLLTERGATEKDMLDESIQSTNTAKQRANIDLVFSMLQDLQAERARRP